MPGCKKTSRHERHGTYFQSVIPHIYITIVLVVFHVALVQGWWATRSHDCCYNSLKLHNNEPEHSSQGIAVNYIWVWQWANQ